MANMPKPELEQGNYIAYADEPGTVISGSGGGGGGGGGAAFLLAPFGDSGIEPQFSFNQVKAFVDVNTPVFIKCETSNDEEGEIAILQVCGIDWITGSTYNVQMLNSAGDAITLKSTDPDENMIRVIG